MTDKRAFAVFDVGYLDNPKIAPLLDEGLSNAVLMHAASVMYCAQHLTDGLITERAMQRKIGASKEDADRLVTEQLWHRPDHSCPSCPAVPEGKAYVHDYLEHNRSSEGVKKASQKGRRAAVARWTAESSAPSMPHASTGHATGNAEPNAKPMPRQTDRQTEKDTPSPSTTPQPFETFWAAYPKKVGKQAAIKAYRNALKLTTPEKILAGVDALKSGVAGKDPRFTPHPATWLSQGRWDDEMPLMPKLSVVPDQYGWANQ